MSLTFLIVILLLLIINLALISWAITDLMQRENAKYLSKVGWIIVIAIVFFGSAIYLLAGRGEPKKKS